MKPIAMRRIGKQPNPAQRGLQLVLENDHIREHVARNLFCHIRQLAGLGADEAWADLSEPEREAWHDEALKRLRQFVLEYLEPHRPPGDPDPGGAPVSLTGWRECPRAS